MPDLPSLTASNGAFSHVLPGLQLIWDSSSLGPFKTCPRKYFYSIICGFGSNAIPLTFGIIFHGATERYDQGRAQGLPHPEAQRLAVRWALEESWLRDADPPGPWTHDDSKRSREALIRTVVWYTEHFQDDPAETLILSDGRAAVELSFKYHPGLEAPTGEPYVLSGHLDRLVQFGDQCFVADRKTTASSLSDQYFARYSPDNQMSMYALASKVVFGFPVAGVMIDAVQLAVNFNRFARGFAHRSEEHLEEWRQGLGDTISRAERYAELAEALPDPTSAWPMNDTACFQYGGCQFREICSLHPKVREKFLNSNFERRQWDPSVARGEPQG